LLCWAAGGWAPADGLSVGNSDEAFPPGLRVDPLPLRKGRPPTGSVDVAPAGAGTVVTPDAPALDPEAAALAAAVAAAPGAVTAIGTDAFAGVVTSVPVPAIVSVTDLTVVAVFAIGTCACSCAGCEASSTVPTVHVAVPFLVQPKLKTGFWLDGDVASFSVTLATFPFLAHTFTFHWAVWPRATLASSFCRLTHSCTVVTNGGGEASVRVKLNSVAVTGALSSVWVTNALALALWLEVLDVSPLISGLSRPLCEAEPDALEADGELLVPELDGAVPESDVLGAGVVVPGSGVGVGVRIDEIDGEGEAELLVGGVVVVEPEGLVGVDVGLVVGPFAHACLVVPVKADVCACSVRARTAWGRVSARMAADPLGAPAWPDVAAATMPKLEADTTRKPPAARLTVGRTCGKRMKALPLPGRCSVGTSLSVGVAITDAYHHV
jgi:hypothetical protein